MAHIVDFDLVKYYDVYHDLASSVGTINKRLQIHAKERHVTFVVRHNDKVVQETIYLSEAVQTYNDIT